MTSQVDLITKGPNELWLKQRAEFRIPKDSRASFPHPFSGIIHSLSLIENNYYEIELGIAGSLYQIVYNTKTQRGRIIGMNLKSNFSVTRGPNRTMITSNQIISIKTEKGEIVGRIISFSPKNEKEVWFSFKEEGTGKIYSGNCNLDTRKGKMFLKNV